VREVTEVIVEDLGTEAIGEVEVDGRSSVGDEAVAAIVATVMATDDHIVEA